MTTFHSSMGAVTADGKHVLLVSGHVVGCSSSCVSKVVIATGEEVWARRTGHGCGVGDIQAAALTIDAGGTSWYETCTLILMTTAVFDTTAENVHTDAVRRAPLGSQGLLMTDSVGNFTSCQLDTGSNALSAVAIAGDGLLLLSNIHGQLSLVA